MERSEIVEHLRISLSVVLDQEIVELSEEQLIQDLEIDSIRFIELVLSLEDTIGLEVDPETLEPEVFRSIGTLVDYIQQCLNRPGTAAAPAPASA